MFTLPVWDLLSSYSGDSKSFSFSGEIYDGYYDDIRFTTPLEFQIRIVALDDWVDVIFDSLKTSVIHDGVVHPIDITGFERVFKHTINPLIDGDDVRPIENGWQMIDLAPVIREEIIMASHSL